MAQFFFALVYWLRVFLHDPKKEKMIFNFVKSFLLQKTFMINSVGFSNGTRSRSILNPPKQSLAISIHRCAFGVFLALYPVTRSSKRRDERPSLVSVSFKTVLVLKLREKHHKDLYNASFSICTFVELFYFQVLQHFWLALNENECYLWQIFL